MYLDMHKLQRFLIIFMYGFFFTSNFYKCELKNTSEPHQ